MKRALIAMGLAAGLVLGVGTADAGIRWLHVHVDEGGNDPTKVRVNVPVSLAGAILKNVDTDGLRHGRVHFDSHEVEKAELQAILAAVKDSPDGELITVETNNETVQAAKKGADLLLKVEEVNRHGTTTVSIRMPIVVVEALLSGDDEELDVLAAVQALDKAGNAEIYVTDSEDDTKVRIWVDDTAGSKRKI